MKAKYNDSTGDRIERTLFFVKSIFNAWTHEEIIGHYEIEFGKKISKDWVTKLKREARIYIAQIGKISHEYYKNLFVYRLDRHYKEALNLNDQREVRENLKLMLEYMDKCGFFEQLETKEKDNINIVINGYAAKRDTNGNILIEEQV